MKRFDVLSGNARVIRTLVTILVLCVLVPWTHAADDNDKPLKRKSDSENYRYDDDDSDTQTSSASVSSSSSSRSQSNGGTSSKSAVTGTAIGNALGAGSANGNASSLRAGKDQNARLRRASSSARAKVKGNNDPTDRYGNSDNRPMASNNSSSTSSVTKNGVQISRSVKADKDVTLTKLDVIDTTQEMSVRESSDGSIEVRLRDRKKNADRSTNEKVYSAATRDELKQQAPELVRKIERYEKMAGTAKASVSGSASSRSQSGTLSSPIGNEGRDAKQMIKDQLEKMLEQNAGNLQLQQMIRKMIQDVDQ
jgi:hypothetical protein